MCQKSLERVHENHNLARLPRVLEVLIAQGLGHLQVKICYLRISGLSRTSTHRPASTPVYVLISHPQLIYTRPGVLPPTYLDEDMSRQRVDPTFLFLQLHSLHQIPPQRLQVAVDLPQPRQL